MKKKEIKSRRLPSLKGDSVTRNLNPCRSAGTALGLKKGQPTGFICYSNSSKKTKIVLLLQSLNHCDNSRDRLSPENEHVYPSFDPVP